MGKTSEWTETLEVEVGPVKVGGVLSAAGDVDPKVIIKMLSYGMWHVLTTP